jgi:hypothetical protein
VAANEMMFCGLALRHADEAAAINSWRSPRGPVDAFATFSGFAPDAASRGAQPGQ